MATILIADDHADITRILVDYAKNEGYHVLVAHDGEEALRLFEKHQVDQVLLDVMMPKKDGFEVCRTIRRTSTVPIIMITARGDDFERIMGLDYGADDYIVKPFSPSEVMARVRAVQRRVNKVQEEADKRLTIENLEIIPLENMAIIDGNRIVLTRTEVDLLHLLASNPERVFTRDQLLDLLIRLRRRRADGRLAHQAATRQTGLSAPHVGYQHGARARLPVRRVQGVAMSFNVIRSPLSHDATDMEELL